MTKKVLLSDLVNHSACKEEADLFKQTFPDGYIEITPENLINVMESFNICWIVDYLFPIDIKQEFHEKNNILANELHLKLTPLKKQIRNEIEQEKEIYKRKRATLISDLFNSF